MKITGPYIFGEYCCGFFICLQAQHSRLRMRYVNSNKALNRLDQMSAKGLTLRFGTI